MNKIRKSIVLFLALVMLFSLTACNTKSKQPNERKEETEQAIEAKEKTEQSIETIEGTDQTTIQVLDSANRTVEVPCPAESIVVLWNNPTEIIRALGAIDRIVGIDTATQSDMELGYYPELKDVTVVGSSEDPNYEMIAKLDPDVVIMLSSYPPLPDEVQKQLDAYNIPVVALDFYRTEVFEREVTILGTILGLEDKAAELMTFLNDSMAQVDEAMKDIAEENRKSVYFEAAADYRTYGGAGYGCGIPGMVRAAYCIDLYPEISAEVFDVNPEDIAMRNPDVIIKGQNGGYFLKESDYEEVYNALISRPELSNTTAVLNNEVYILSFDVSGGARKVFGPMYMAKILYPDYLANFDPDAVLKEYLETYLGREWQGVYVYSK